MYEVAFGAGAWDTKDERPSARRHSEFQRCMLDQCGVVPAATELCCIDSSVSLSEIRKVSRRPHPPRCAVRTGDSAPTESALLFPGIRWHVLIR